MKTIKSLRLDRDLNQQTVANYLGITQQAYANYERGVRQPDPSTLSKLADFFEVTVDYLLGRTDFSIEENRRICQNVTRLWETIKNPPNPEGIRGITQPYQQIKKNEYQFTYEVLEQFASYLGVSVDDLIAGIKDSTSPAITPQISEQENLLLKEYTDLTDNEKQEVLNFIRFKKTQIKKPFTSSKTRSFTTADFEDNTERIAAFGGIEENDDEPLTT